MEKQSDIPYEASEVTCQAGYMATYESPSAEIILLSREPVTLTSTGRDIEVDYGDIF